jgi:hypothetical protein
MSNKQKQQKAGAQVRSQKAQRRSKAKPAAVALPMIRLDTAGIDIGSMEMVVAVSADRDEESEASAASHRI